MKYREIGDVPFGAWEAEFDHYPTSPLRPKARALYDISRGHTAISFMHLKRESELETVRDKLSPSDNNPYNLRPNHLFPAKGATGEKNGYLTFDSVESAAREWRRRVVDDPNYYRLLPDGTKVRYTAGMELAEYIEAYAPVGDAHETTGDANETYYDDAVSILTRILAWKEEQPVAETFVKHIFPGLPNPVYLPDWIPVEFKIIPNGVAGWTSGQKIPASNFTSTTYHDTGNPSTNANAEYTWARNGGRRDAPGSYNGIFDGTPKLIITQRFDELVGHAANHQGNITSYAFEEAYGGAGNSHDKALDVGMWVHAGVLQSMGRTGTDAMYQHFAWSGKNCPAQIRSRNQWSTVEKTVDARIAEITKFINGGAIPKPPTPEVPPLAAFLFGKVGTYSFNPNGPVSKLWLKNGNETGSFPRLIDVQEGKPKYFVFSDGSVIVDNAGKLDYLLKV